MSEQRIEPTQSLQEAQALRAQIVKKELQNLENRIISQIESQQDFEEWCSMGEFSMRIKKKFKPLKELKTKKKEKKENAAQIEEIKKTDEQLDKSATKFQKNNYELDKQTLILLKNSISAKATAKEILDIVLGFYKDPSLADEALDFLLETTTGDLQKEVQKAKDNFNAKFKREIQAGKNIKQIAQEYSKEGLQTTNVLRDLYRDVTGIQRTPIELFEEFAKAFDFDKIKTLIKFLFTSLGSDLKSKGPSISRAELIKLMEDTRALQAILGVYKFFKSRMKLINSQFKKNQMTLQKNLNFETLAKEFTKLIASKYISSDVVLQIGRYLGLSDELIAQIIIFTQMRDAIRNTAPRLYKSKNHRQELLEALIEALEELEEELEEQEEEEEEEEQ